MTGYQEIATTTPGSRRARRQLAGASPKLTCLAGAFALVLAACTTTAPSDELAATEQAERVIAPPAETTLAMLRLSPTHSVRFMESADGELSAYESGHIDLDHNARRLNDFPGDEATLEMIHAFLAPGVAVPQALIAADARAAQRQPDPSAPPPGYDDAVSADLAGPPVTEQGSVAWDWNAEAQWFMQHFCNGGDQRFCRVNFPYVHQTEKRLTKWYKVTALNQSHWSPNGAHFVVQRTYGCGFLGWSLCWGTKVDEWIGDRFFSGYFGSGSKHRRAYLDGTGNEARVAMAVMWKNASGGQPTPPPQQCGGHLQYACNSGSRCALDLTEYNHACYGCGVIGEACCKDWGPIPTEGGAFGSCTQGVCDYPGGYCRN